MARITTEDGVQIHYRITGPEDGRPLIFSNSLGTNLAMWDRQREALAGSFRIIGYDQRGHGNSDAPAGDYTMPRLAKDVIDLMDALGIEVADYCGLSMGGMAGLWLGAHHRARFGKMVLANMLAHFGMDEMWNQRISAVNDGGIRAISGAVLDRWFTSGFREKEPMEVDRLLAMLNATNPKGYTGCCAAVRDLDLREELSQFQDPVLVITGAHDLATPPDRGRAVAEAIASANHLELDAAHLSNIEKPDAFTAALREFFGS